MPPAHHQPLTAVALVCKACLDHEDLAPTISAFIDPKIRNVSVAVTL